MSRGRIYIGTSGFSYDAWRGAFYPADLPSREFLRHYATRLSSVEINMTFRRFPTPRLLQGWKEQAGSGFAFALKANQRITHERRLLDVEESVTSFVEICRSLGEALGPILFQLPPNFKRDDARLAGLLAGLPPGVKAAFEFRHASWLDDQVYALLDRSAAALCVAETDEQAATVRDVGSFSYYRLRKEAYEEAEVAAWAAHFRQVLATGSDVYVYFKHEETGTGAQSALRLRELTKAE